MASLGNCSCGPRFLVRLLAVKLPGVVSQVDMPDMKGSPTVNRAALPCPPKAFTKGTIA